jgi:Ca2+-binding EF-hand superfamily protein
MDRDHNGALTRQELDCEEFFQIVRSVLLPDAVVGVSGPAYARANMDLDQAINFVVRKADINHDNKITFDEFKAFILALRQPQLAVHTANLIFALFDVNRDMKLDQKEFRQIYSFYLGGNPTEDKFQEEWALLDPENKGRVSRKEYVKWMQTSDNPVFRLHAPPPSSAFISGNADYHTAKKEFLDTSPGGSSRLAPLPLPKPLPTQEAPAINSRVEAMPGSGFMVDGEEIYKAGDHGNVFEIVDGRASIVWDRTGLASNAILDAFDERFRIEAPAPWRPWHAYTNMCWAQVRQTRMDKTAGKSSPSESRATSQSNSRRKSSRRPYVMHAAPNRMSRSMGSFLDPDRPFWNQRLAVSNPNWPDSTGKPRRPKGMRGFLSKPQTMDDLSEHYKTNSNFGANLKKLKRGDQSFDSKYSTDRLEVRSSPELLPLRSKLNYGRMKNLETGKRKPWQDNWVSIEQLKDKYVSGTMDFRCPGSPPRHLYMDEYYDER